LLQTGNNLGIQDWDQHFAFAETIRQSIVDHRQLPLWNPYHCGGTSLVAFPENEVFSPSTLFVVVFGSVVGYKVAFGFFLFIGFIGFYFLGRYMRLSLLPTFMMAITYLLSGMYLVSYASGMTNYLSLAYLPYVLLFCIRTFEEQTRVYPVLLGISLALVFFAGMHYLVIIFFAVTLYALISALTKKSARPLARYGVMLLCFVLLSAPKLFPSVETIQSIHIQQKEYFSGYSLASLAFSLFSRDQTFTGYRPFSIPTAGFLHGSSYDIEENSMYVGIVPFLLFCIGVIVSWKKRIPIVVIFLIFSILMFGYMIQPSLYGYLQQFPLFESMRVAQRYRFVVLLIVSLFVGHGMQWILSKCAPYGRRCRIGAIIVATCICLDLLQVNTTLLFKHAFAIPDISLPVQKEFIQTCDNPPYGRSGFIKKTNSYSSYSSEYLAVRSNTGVTKWCYEVIPYPDAATCFTDKRYRGEYYLKQGQERVSLTRSSSNVMVFDVNPQTRDTLIINQNYDRNWLVYSQNRVRPAIDSRGLLSTPVDSGIQTITFFYVPWAFVIGVSISFLTMLALGYWCFLSIPSPVKKLG
jgi:hypothetical protein